MFLNTKMYYDAEEKVLKNKFQQYIKHLDCPMNQQWENLTVVPDSEIKRYCDECKKVVLNINNMNSDQVEAIVKYDPAVCLYFSEQARHIELTDFRLSDDKRIIYTARTIEAMNIGVKKGLYPLIQEVVRNDDIKQMIAFTQDSETGEIRLGMYGEHVYWYNSECYEYPFAAYLIPSDLQKGEVVLLDDLIEEHVGVKWNRGDTSRLRKAFATWNGSGFDIDPNEKLPLHIVG